MNTQITTIPTVHAALHTKVSTIPTLNDFVKDVNLITRPNKIGAIPIVESNISQVNNVIVQQQQQQQHANSNTNADGKSEDDEDEVMEDEYTLDKFIDLKQFTPKTLEDQLNEAVITGFKDLSNETLEQMLVELLETVEFQWSCIEEVDVKIVLIRLLDKDLEKRVTILHRLITLGTLVLHRLTLKVSVEKNTKRFVQDTLKDESSKNLEVNTEELIKKLNKILERSKSKTRAQVKDTDYVIDDNELKGIPLDLLPQLKKDIKEFRLRAVENEKRKREKEVLEEKKRAKLQLRKLFEKFRNETTGRMDVDVPDEDDEDEEGDEDDDEMTDEQYEEMMVKKETQDIAIKLQVVHSEEKKNAELSRELTHLKDYESKLDKTIKKEYELGHFKPSGTNKEREVEDDKKDREDEAQEEISKKKSDEFLASINIPLKLNLNNEEEDHEEKEEDINVLVIDDEKLEEILLQVKPKVNSYLEELMGVEDEELTDYVISIVNDERSKDKLQAELEEPLGEEAAVFADKLWADIRAML